MLNLISTKITGVPGLSGWSQVYDFIPDSQEKKDSKGHLFLVVAADQSQEGIENMSLGREISSKIRDQYFNDLDKDLFTNLKDAVKSCIDQLTVSNGNLEIVAMAFVENISYVVAGGGAQIHVLRGKSLAKILASESQSLISASGYPQKGDVMILSTKEFTEKIKPEILKNAVEENSLEETISPLVQESGKMAANFVSFSQNVFPTDYVSEPIVDKPPTLGLQDKLEEVKKTFESTIGRIQQNIKGKIPQRSIYVKDSIDFEAESQNKKITLSVGIILLLILGVSIFFGIKQKNAKELESMYLGSLVEANQNLDEAIGLVEVSPDEARQLFILAQEKLVEVESFGSDDPKIEELRKRIEEQKGLAFGEYKVETSLFTDLTLLSSGFKGDLISSSEGNLFVLDKTGNKIVSLEISNKKSRVVAGPDKINNVLGLASYGDRVFILDGDGVKAVDENVNTVVIKDWDGESLIYGFAGNMYVLDKSGNQIYRYAGSGDSFGSKQNWLSSTTKPDFSNSKSWVIDGSVYVLNNNGRVQKFSLGSSQSFSMTGVYPEVSSIDAIYASDETEFVYLLDKTDKRVIVVDKKGNYKAQYFSDDISNANGLVVSEAEGKIILLTGEKLLSIETRK